MCCQWWLCTTGCAAPSAWAARLLAIAQRCPCRLHALHLLCRELRAASVQRVLHLRAGEPRLNRAEWLRQSWDHTALNDPQTKRPVGSVPAQSCGAEAAFQTHHVVYGVLARHPRAGILDSAVGSRSRLVRRVAYVIAWVVAACRVQYNRQQTSVAH